ncbi:cupin [Chitinophagaceae bacterium MMS25-I14]
MSTQYVASQYLKPIPEKIPHYFLSANDIFPNSVLPVLHYRGMMILSGKETPSVPETVFGRNNWTNSWRNGILTEHHYHSNTHEVLGCYSGSCHVQLGGDMSIILLFEKGDVLIIPAGVAHKNVGGSQNFKCVGAYPEGAQYDMNYGKADERPQADHNISKVRVPETDPLYGHNGFLTDLWNNITQ